MARPRKDKVNNESRNKDSHSENSNARTLIIVAIIGAVATIIASLIGILPQMGRNNVTSTPTQFVLPMTVTSTQFLTPNSTSTSTNIPQPSPTSTDFATLTSTPVLSEIIDGKDAQMVLVPQGEFTMGSNNGDSNEQPVHKVYLSAYYIDKYEVTNSQYKVCVNLGACRPLDNTLYYDNDKYADHPVTFVNWHLANAYCSWREARLPTESEWEKAARGQSETNYPWGNAIDCSYANYRGKNGHCVGESTSVGSYENGKSIYGVYDMVGNATEWVSSMYADYPYVANDGREGLAGSGVRIIRGGSWNNYDTVVRSTNRAWISPSGAEFDFGFRCAKDATP